MLPQAIVLTALVALGACQFLGDATTPPSARERLGLEPEATSGDYPSLHTVPPRAQLSYSVQQRRSIVEGLVADRENARYTDRVVRYRSGQSSLPPPPAPPRDVAAVDTEGLLEPDPEAEVESTPAEPPAASPFDDDGGLGGVYDDGDEEDTLDSFVDELARDPVAEQADDAGVPAEPAAPVEDDGRGFMDWLGDLFGQAAPATPELTAVPAMQPVSIAQGSSATDPAQRGVEAMPSRPDPSDHGIAIGVEGVAIESHRTGRARRGEAARLDQPAPATAAPAVTAIGIKTAAPTKPEVPPLPPIAAPVGRIPFAPGSAALPAGASAQLEQVLAAAKAQGAVIRILGEAPAPVLALDRARAVGLALVRLGAGASDLEMTLAHRATGDQAQLLFARRGAR